MPQLNFYCAFQAWIQGTGSEFGLAFFQSNTTVVFDFDGRDEAA